MNSRLSEYFNEYVNHNDLMHKPNHKLIAFMELVESKIENEKLISRSDFDEICDNNLNEIF